MGHQLYAKANGAKTYKMKFDTVVSNPCTVREIVTGRIDFKLPKPWFWTGSREILAGLSHDYA